MGIEIRTILEKDNPFLAKIIRNTLEEFGETRPGTVYFDDATDHLSDSFTNSMSIYYVALEDGNIIGGAGIFPTNGLPADTCELVKMYLIPSARGKGVGKLLINICLNFAKENGYKKVYLESMPELKTAIAIYEKHGFNYLNSPLGDTGHFGCDIRMIKEL